MDAPPFTTDSSITPQAPTAVTTQADPRGRLILILTSLAALLVMGGLVVLALSGGPAATPPSNAGASLGLPPGTPALPPGCAADPERPPRLVVDLPPEGVDFGAVRQNQSLERVVRFRNEGTGLLCLLQEGTPCGCVKLALRDPTKRRFEPGESGELILTLNTQDHAQEQIKSFWVYTNELNTTRQTWPVKANISQGVIVNTSSLAFGRRRRGEAATANLRLTSPKGDAPWTVTEIVAEKLGERPPAVYRLEVKEVEDPKVRVLEVTVHLPGRNDEGSWSERAVLKTSHPDRPEIALTAFMDVVRPLQTVPAAVPMGFTDTAKPWAVHVRALLPGVTFRVTQAVVEPLPGAPQDAQGPGFAATLSTDPGDGHPIVEVRYDGHERPPGQVEATLVLHTDLAEQTELRVPLRATVPAPKRGTPPEPG